MCFYTVSRSLCKWIHPVFWPWSGWWTTCPPRRASHPTRIWWRGKGGCGRWRRPSLWFSAPRCFWGWCSRERASTPATRSTAAGSWNTTQSLRASSHDEWKKNLETKWKRVWRWERRRSRGFLPAVLSAVIEQFDHVWQKEPPHLHALRRRGSGLQQSSYYLQNLYKYSGKQSEKRDKEMIRDLQKWT